MRELAFCWIHFLSRSFPFASMFYQRNELMAKFKFYFSRYHSWSQGSVLTFLIWNVVNDTSKVLIRMIKNSWEWLLTLLSFGLHIFNGFSKLIRRRPLAISVILPFETNFNEQKTYLNSQPSSNYKSNFDPANFFKAQINLMVSGWLLQFEF